MKTITKETPRQTLARLEKRADEMQAEYWAAHYAHRFGESSEIGDELERLLERIEQMRSEIEA